LHTTQGNLLNNFREYLEVEKGLSENSIYSYSYDLKKFSFYLENQEKGFLEVEHEDIQNFIKEQRAKDISARTLARSVAAIRQFYKYLMEEKQLNQNPTENIETPEIKKTLPDYLTQAEIEELFSCIDEEDTFELRDKAIFELLYSSGLRISEACNLKVQDIDLENMFVIVKGGKGGRERLVPLGETAHYILTNYLKNSRDQILRGRFSDFLFISKKGSSLNRKSVWRLLKKYLARTKINKAVTPHTLRHSFATHLLENEADLKSVQELLGHIDISTTQMYTHLANKTLQEIHRKYHPRG
jgi:integrase/recombinase XerD